MKCSHFQELQHTNPHHPFLQSHEQIISMQTIQNHTQVANFDIPTDEHEFKGINTVENNYRLSPSDQCNFNTLPCATFLDYHRSQNKPYISYLSNSNKDYEKRVIQSPNTVIPLLNNCEEVSASNMISNLCFNATIVSNTSNIQRVNDITADTTSFARNSVSRCQQEKQNTSLHKELVAEVNNFNYDHQHGTPEKIAPTCHTDIIKSPNIPFFATIESINSTFSITSPSSIHIVPKIQNEEKNCRIKGCDCLVTTRRPYCIKHIGNRTCEHAGCAKCAQGATRFCIAHGGGRRCTIKDCDKGARDRYFCAAHGGGKRCVSNFCNKSAVGGSNLCTSHGGGRRCATERCEKSAQSSTRFCVKHGGGKKCAQIECDKVARGKTFYCAGHGGGVRCKLEGCMKVAVGKKQLCRHHGGGSNTHLSINKKGGFPERSQVGTV